MALSSLGGRRSQYHQDDAANAEERADDQHGVNGLQTPQEHVDQEQRDKRRTGQSDDCLGRVNNGSYRHPAEVINSPSVPLALIAMGTVRPHTRWIWQLELGVDCTLSQRHVILAGLNLPPLILLMDLTRMTLVKDFSLRI